MTESAADKRQRLRRLKKQLATIEALLQEDSEAAQAAVARTTGRGASTGGGSDKSWRRAPPPPQTPGTAAATTKAFGARGGPANAKLRERLKQPADKPSAGLTDASFAAALQDNFRARGPVSCEDSHQLLKEREAKEHAALMRDARVAAAATAGRIDARMKALELNEARERAARAAEARRTRQAAPAAECPASSAAIPGPSTPPRVTWSADGGIPPYAASGVVDPDPAQPEPRERGGPELRSAHGSEAAARQGDDGRQALRSSAKELWRAFNKELARSAPPRMPPRLRLPPPGWTAKDLENLEMRILQVSPSLSFSFSLPPPLSLCV